MQKFLIIQTAFIGDVILSTALIEKIRLFYPDAQIDFVLRKGNESLLKKHPHLTHLYVFDKQKSKYQNLFKLILEIRKQKYDSVINVQRFATTGLMTVFSNAKEIIGFNKNPFSFLFSKQVKHSFAVGKHEVERNQELINHLTDDKPSKPKLYPSFEDYEKIRIYQSSPYICIAPASVWYTKQYPAHKWADFVNELPPNFSVYLLGGKEDIALCKIIAEKVLKVKVHILAGQLTFLASAALMQDAEMNYVNDSSPMHLASSVNAPTCAVFCSTVPGFGFGPLSDKSFIVETLDKLNCRPCGIHGYKTCPEGHFKCAETISATQLKNVVR